MQGCISFVSRYPALALALALFPCAGCVVSEKIDTSAKAPAHAGKPPTGTIMQVHCFWNKQLMLVNQGIPGGRPLAGISGRVYFFGKELKNPLGIDGECLLVVEMAYLLPDGKPQTARYEFRKHDIDPLLHRDSLGFGYTLPLPWAEYRPGIKEVTIRVTLTQEKGNAIFSKPTHFVLERPGGMQGTVRQMPVTAENSQATVRPGAAVTGPQTAVNGPQTPAAAAPQPAPVPAVFAPGNQLRQGQN